jgi:putative ABC transport system substrate-binding protein
MKRRELMVVLVAAAGSWPIVAPTQQAERVRRVGVLMLYTENDPEGQARALAFREGLEKRGWTIGRNLQIEFQWGLGDTEWIRSATARLLRLAPDVILANGPSALRPAQQATSTVPIIFIAGADPVLEGFVQSLAHPGGNLTGFAVLEPSVGAKLLELLKEIAPSVTRVAVMVNPDSTSSLHFAGSAAAAASKFAVEVVTVSVRDSAQIEAAIIQFGRESGRGIIIPPDPVTNTHRKLIVELAARYRVPAIYALRAATVEGGLISYGVDLVDLFRQAAVYVDRVLRGEKPSDLPVQQPTKFELVVNLKAAKALGITIPQSLRLRADDVIQ